MLTSTIRSMKKPRRLRSLQRQLATLKRDFKPDLLDPQARRAGRSRRALDRIETELDIGITE